MICRDASLPRIDIDNLQTHLFRETIDAASTAQLKKRVPSLAGRERCAQSKKAVRFDKSCRITTVVGTHEESRNHSPTEQDAESLISFLPSTVPETMDEVMIDEALAADIEVEEEDREAHAQDTQNSNATQPISQTVYEKVIRSRSEQLSSLPSDPEPKEMDIDAAESENEEDGHLQDSLQQGDSEFVDICSSFAAAPDGPESIPLEPTQTQHGFTQFPESQRFRTPATAGKKRDFSGNLIDTPVESRNPFARKGAATPGNVLGLSQAFANTQAASSPMHAMPTSELRSDKPSPGILVRHNARGLPTSSPSRPLSETWRASEPALRYISAGQSQALRKAMTSEAENHRATQESTTDDFDSVPSVVEQRRRAREREAKARKELEAASSPLSPQKHDPIEIGDLPRRAASENPIRIRRKSQSRSLPSSPPAINGEESIEDIEDSADDETAVADVSVFSRRDVLRQPVTSSASARVESTGLTLVPATTKRTIRSLVKPRFTVQPSPSEQRSRHGRSPFRQEPVSSNPVRIINSQRSITLTQEADVAPVVSSAESIDVIPASPEGHLQSTEPSDLQHRTGTDAQVLDENIGAAENATNSADQPASDTIEHNDRDKTNSPTPVPDKQRANTYQTALTHQPRDTSSVAAAEFSSQPVRATPPGRKRKRLGEISQENVLPAASQGSAFDFMEVLEDTEFSKAITSSHDPDPIQIRKRVRLEPPVLVQQADPDQMAPSTSSNSANIGRQLRTKNVTVDHEHQDVENAPSSSSLSELPVTPNVNKTPPRMLSVPKSVYSPGESPQPLSARLAAKARTQTLKNGLHEAVAGRPPRVVSKTKLRTPTMIPIPLPAIRESSPDPPATSTTSTTTGTPVPTTSQIIAPQMIFAHFMDKQRRGYYPAVCQGYSAAKHEYTIQWPGFDPEPMPEHATCSLDLRIGDEIKVDREGWPKIVWRIRGFVPAAETEGTDMLRDIYGHGALLLEPKSSKILLAKGVGKDEPVPIEQIYLDSNQFSRFKKRPFQYTKPTDAGPADEIPRPSTPQVQISMPSTPSSRGRNAGKDVSVQSAIRQGIFSSMVFAISMADDEVRISDVIRKNGGVIITTGFQDLLDGTAQLKSDFKDTTFTALLTNRHSRTEKYLQALALGLPCLSTRWVDVSARREQLVNWQDYLLPAGESVELEGAIRSRILPPFDMASTKLSQILETRPKFFTDTSGIFVAGRRTEEQRKTYMFFVRVMGMVKIEQANDIQAARALLETTERTGTTWVIVDDKDLEKARQVVNSVLDKPLARRKSNGKDTDGWRVRVADSEFLKQSLVLGRLSNIDLDG